MDDSLDGGTSDSSASPAEKLEIREELSAMTLEEILNLKEELGLKVYQETILGTADTSKKRKVASTESKNFERSNKNRPREVSSKHQVPYLRNTSSKKNDDSCEPRDPRFDEKAGTYDTKVFKENYKFVSDIRENEVQELKKVLQNTKDIDKKKEIVETIKKLKNKNTEDSKWHKKQALLKEEQKEREQKRAEGKRPHFLTKKERRAKELVMKFEELKKTGKLSQHIEKRRKKNAAKDRKKFNV